MGFSRQECWSGLSFPPSPGDLPDPGIEPGSPELQADSLPPDPQGKPTRSTLVGVKDQLYSSAVTVGQDQRKALVQPWWERRGSGAFWWSSHATARPEPLRGICYNLPTKAAPKIPFTIGERIHKRWHIRTMAYSGRQWTSCGGGVCWEFWISRCKLPYIE